METLCALAAEDLGFNKLTSIDRPLNDMFVRLWSQSRIIEATYGAARHAWRRHLHLMLNAYRADRATPLPEPPLTRTQMEQATARLNWCPERAS